MYGAVACILLGVGVVRGALWAKRYHHCYSAYSASRPAEISPESLDWKTAGIALGDDETRVAELLGRFKTPAALSSPRMKSVEPPWPGFTRLVVMNHGSTATGINDIDCVQETLRVYFDEEGKARLVGRSITNHFRIFGRRTRDEYVDLATRTVHEDGVGVFGESRS
jgi:hypothetical protein